MQWTAGDAAAWVAVPRPDDDKYSRGVLGLVTGSERYPGAGVLSAEAALHTGVGMLRYLGGAPGAVLARRPEAVTSEGRVQAWVLGSGIDHDDAVLQERMRSALGEGVPTVLDAGAVELVSEARGPVVITPHTGELARLLGVERAEVTWDPAGAAEEAMRRTGATVLLKGSTSYIRGDEVELEAAVAPAWLATAGAGDALGGILGALVATHHPEPDLPRLAATAAVLHGLAAERASGGGPFTVLHLCHALPRVIAELLSAKSS